MSTALSWSKHYNYDFPGWLRPLSMDPFLHRQGFEVEGEAPSLDGDAPPSSASSVTKMTSLKEQRREEEGEVEKKKRMMGSDESL